MLFNSFKVRVFGSITLLVIALSLFFAVASIYQQDNSLKKALLNRGFSIVRNLSKDSELGVLTGNKNFLLGPLKSLKVEEDLVFAIIYDLQGTVLANESFHSPWGKPSDLEKDTLLEDVKSKILRQKDEPYWRIKPFGDKPVYEFWQPVYGGKESQEGESLIFGDLTADSDSERGKDEIIGFVRCALSLEGINALKRELAQASLSLMVVFLLVGSFLAYLLARMITGPIGTLMKASESVAGGDLAQSIDIRRSDEVGRLAMAFNEMIRALKEREGTLRHQAKIINEIHDSVISVSSDGFITSWNHGATRLFGYSEQEMVGQKAFRLFGEGEENFLTTDFFRSHRKRGSHDIENKMVRQSGEEFYALHSLSLVKNALNNTDELICYSLDITEKKKGEEERRRMEEQVQHAQKLESLGVLAGGIAHDFNNLLMGVLGNASLALIELSKESPARESVEKIETAAIRAAELTKQMLAYSGKGKFVLQAINMSSLVEEMAHLLETVISKKITINYHFEPSIPSIEGDPTQIRQIVMNLFTNASDAIGDNRGTISLSTGSIKADKSYLSWAYFDEELEPGCYVYIEVSDTGSGMDEETQAKIFDPFFTTKFTGRGLGLAAVLGIVRGHKGSMKVYSEKGKGTTFKVLLPCSDRMAEPTQATTISRDEWKGHGTILIVDDEEGVREVARRMLKKGGYEVITACDGMEGVEVFKERSHEIRAVILDMTMPRMSGEEAFREIHRMSPKTKVVLSSGYNEQDATGHFSGKGLAGFIQKPYQMENLLGKMEEILGATDD